MQDVAVEVPGGVINVWHRPPQDDQQTVVLVHGLSGTSRWWSRVIEHLPPGLGVISVDVRGRGGSVKAPPPYDLATMADDIARAMDHFGIEKTTVAGYSMGGWIVAIFGQRHPERAARLVLVDGGLPIPSDPGADADEIIDAVVGPSLARLEGDFSDEEQFFDLWKAHPALKAHWDDAMREPLAYELSKAEHGFAVVANPEAIRVSARQITVDPETKSAAANVGVPCHLIVVERGTADQEGGMIPLETARAAATANPNLTIEYLPGLNHYTLVLGAGAPVVATAITAAH